MSEAPGLPPAHDAAPASVQAGATRGRRRAPTPVPCPPPAGVPRRRPVHPGQFLQRQVLSPLALTQTDVARLLGISRRRVNELVHGQRAMSADTAIRCALAFGLDVDHILGLQSRWDSWHQWMAMRGHRLSTALPAPRT